MAAMVERWAGLGSAMASIIFLWSMVQNHVPAALRLYLTAWVAKIAACFSPYLRITILENSAERFQQSEFFYAVEAYLSDACARRARRLKAELGSDSSNLQVSVDDHEEVTDEFSGVTLWWYASKKHSKGNVISFYPGEDERRFYQVVFHRRHRDLVVDSYLPFVLAAGRAVIIKNRERRLFTNCGGRRRRYLRNSVWDYVKFEHPATFDTLAMDTDQKEAIIDDLIAFKDGKEYYTKVGKAWKRGYLLYGPPGTGKSTMIAAMANFLDYDVYDLELTSVSGLLNFLDSDNEYEHDATESQKDDDSKVTLSGLLNFIDGLWSASGGERIIIFTTNHKEKLDPALVRRGRMDKHIEMSYCRFEGFKVLAKNYLDVIEHELFGEIRKLLEETDMSPADVAENLMPMSKKKKKDPDISLAGLIEALRQAKEDASAAKARRRQKQRKPMK